MVLFKSSSSIIGDSDTEAESPRLSVSSSASSVTSDSDLFNSPGKQKHKLHAISLEPNQLEPALPNEPEDPEVNEIRPFNTKPIFPTTLPTTNIRSTTISNQDPVIFNQQPTSSTHPAFEFDSSLLETDISTYHTRLYPTGLALARTPSPLTSHPLTLLINSPLQLTPLDHQRFPSLISHHLLSPTRPNSSSHQFHPDHHWANIIRAVEGIKRNLLGDSVKWVYFDQALDDYKEPVVGNWPELTAEELKEIESAGGWEDEELVRDLKALDGLVGDVEVGIRALGREREELRARRRVVRGVLLGRVRRRRREDGGREGGKEVVGEEAEERVEGVRYVEMTEAERRREREVKRRRALIEREIAGRKEEDRLWGLMGGGENALVEERGKESDKETKDLTATNEDANRKSLQLIRRSGDDALDRREAGDAKEILPVEKTNKKRSRTLTTEGKTQRKHLKLI